MHKPDSQTTTCHRTYDAGLLVRGYVRDVLEKMTFEIPGSRYRESKSILSSKFFVEAPMHAIATIDNWIERVNAND
jgi:homoserine trans-succinylase